MAVALILAVWPADLRAQTTFNVNSETGFNNAAGSIATQSAGDTSTPFSINFSGGFGLSSPFGVLSLVGGGNTLVVSNPSYTLTLASTGTAPQTIISSNAGPVTITNGGIISLTGSNLGSIGATGSTGLSGTTGALGAGGMGGLGGNGFATGSIISLTGTGVTLSATNGATGSLSVTSIAIGGAGGAGGTSGSNNSGTSGTTGSSGGLSNPGGNGTGGANGNQGGDGGLGGNGTALGSGIVLLNSGGMNIALNSGTMVITSLATGGSGGTGGAALPGGMGGA
ncbi:MAG TPA: hypothetical protein VG733_07495, partial [Chthoniobacteraceae bacterium]|nr:hypothetical protein [Chthoniobacteraceae bacterium]